MSALTKEQFGSDFKWGVSAAAYQIEGANDMYGKGPSIWDVFANTKGKISAGQNANITCDFYNRYIYDLILMRGMNIRNFRFSIAWSRIFPEGMGRINRAGKDFYNRVIDFCLELGIEPWITLYHWDLPQTLETKGGWTNREIIDWFSDYISFCIKAYGDRVNHWMILNEPMVFTGAGYFLGLHAPGKKGLANFLPAVHHAALAQAEGGRIIRSVKTDAIIGTTFSCSYIEPHAFTESDQAAANKMDVLLNRMFLEPLLGLSYPFKDLKLLNRITPYMRQDDEAKLAFDMDFIGIQNYTREIVRHTPFVPYVYAKIIKADKRNVEKTVMGWEVYPESIYYMLQKFSSYKQIKNIIITENGAAFPDEVIDGKVKDEKRKVFIKNNLKQIFKAKSEGINVTGYFIWTFTDNFEWAEGYKPRFGLVHVNFRNQKRIVKSSGHWYRQFLT